MRGLTLDKQNLRGTSASSRPLFLAGLAAVVVAALAAILFLTQKASPGAPGANADAAAPIAGAPAGPVVARTAAPTAAAPQWLQEMIRIIKDPSLPLGERQNAVKSLIQNGSPEALAALKEALYNGAQDLRLTAAEAMRGCASADCAALLLALAHDPDEAVALAAVQALGVQDSPEAATALTELLSDTAQPSSVRCAAALGLGSMDQFGVVGTLIQAAKQFDEEDVAVASLKALGRRDFSETESFFQDFLQSGDTPTDLRVAAVGALGAADGDPTAFLTKIAGDSDSDVRIAAAEALSATLATGNAGPTLLNMVQNEDDPDVRLRLYQALRNQESYDLGTALGLVQAEADPSARIAGFDMLAKALRDNPTPALQQFFEQTATPELVNDALNGQTFDDRQSAIIALTRAHTPGTQAALQELAAQLAPPAAPPGGK
jgi:HEAT repeat protein